MRQLFFSKTYLLITSCINVYAQEIRVCGIKVQGEGGRGRGKWGWVLDFKTVIAAGSRGDFWNENFKLAPKEMEEGELNTSKYHRRDAEPMFCHSFILKPRPRRNTEY